MRSIIDLLEKPYPWYVSGPLLGLIVPLLILTSNKQFGVSSSFRHICSLLKLSKKEYFVYNFKEHEWSSWFLFGVLIAGVFAFNCISVEFGRLSSNAIEYFFAKNIEVKGVLPDFFAWDLLFSKYGILLLAGGFCIGFGARYADGCTSGHAIMGLSLLSAASLIAVIGFFIGGVVGAFLILDYLL